MSPDARDLELVRLGRSEVSGDPASPPSSAALARADEAFARLYDRHAPLVRALCLSACRNDADDALQETFIRAYRMLDKFEDNAAGDGFRPWLYAIARLVCSERRRAAGRRVRHERIAVQRTGLVERGGLLGMDPSEAAHVNHTATGAPVGESATPTSSMDQREQLDLLSEALEQLPDDERLAVHLYYLDADPVTAASACLGVSRSGFYKLLARARERLADLMSRSPA